MTELVRGLDDVELTDRPQVGGKAASLGELIGARIPVPPGFVVTTWAFAAALETLDPSGEIRASIEALEAEDTDGIARACAGARRRIEEAPLPQPVHDAIAARYHELGSEAPVAVRSSATSEDSAEASFAGLQDTFLWVPGEHAVLERVRACWASLYSVESVTYRLRQRLGEGHLAMAVVVQRMIDARSAGVMFTRSPTTGDRSVISIEGSWGLGSAVVSGEVTPDTYIVSKVTGEIVRRAVSTKLRTHRVDSSGTGTVEQEVPPGQQQEPCLTDDEIAELAALARRVEEHYGAPQDIEWALTGEGDLMLLQSRPETVWAGREAAPVAAPKVRPYDHVLDLMRGGGRR